MAGRFWYQSPLFYILLVLVTTALFVFHGPILHGLETWADRYFSQKGISNTLGWMTDPEAGIFESLGRLVVGLVACLFFIVFAVVVWVFLYSWKRYLFVPVVGGVLAWCLWVVVEPLVPKWQRKKTEQGSPMEIPTQTWERGSTFRISNATEETPASRRARIEAWLRSDENGPRTIGGGSDAQATEAVAGRVGLGKKGWGFRRG